MQPKKLHVLNFATGLENRVIRVLNQSAVMNVILSDTFLVELICVKLQSHHFNVHLYGFKYSTNT